MLFAKLDNGGCSQYVMALRFVNNAVVIQGQEEKLLCSRFNSRPTNLSNTARNAARNSSFPAVPCRSVRGNGSTILQHAHLLSTERS